jgi:KUP system potassium uptake protein
LFRWLFTGGALASAKRTGGLATAVLGALGVVYGDIGTSPLYSLKEAFHFVDPTQDNVYGLLSLVFWSMTLVVTFKYVIHVLSADHEGDGGIPALLALLHKKIGFGYIMLAIFGVGLLYGDGMITPAISVLSAIEGLEEIYPGIDINVIESVTIAILVALFAVQRIGTSRIGFLFGPIMCVWFASLAYYGIGAIREHPSVLFAMSPHYGILFLLNNTLIAAPVLGAVVLVVTGGEALYADLAHFGKRAIRVGWFLAMPALLLNYFGQGAGLLANPEAAHSPFYNIIPQDHKGFMVVLSTLATVIASQALITGAFSLTKALSDQHQLPPFPIFATSRTHHGQIYVSGVNWMLLFGAVCLVMVFRESGNLAAAYGIAVTGTMSVTTVLYYKVLRKIRNYTLLRAGALCGFFLFIDLGFFVANIHKISDGGYIPLGVGIMLTLAMQGYYMHARKVRKEKKQPLPTSVSLGKPHVIVLTDELVHKGTLLELAVLRQIGADSEHTHVVHFATDPDRKETVRQFLADRDVEVVMKACPSGDWVTKAVEYIGQKQAGTGGYVWVVVSQRVTGRAGEDVIHAMNVSTLQASLRKVPKVIFTVATWCGNGGHSNGH